MRLTGNLPKRFKAKVVADDYTLTLADLIREVMINLSVTSKVLTLPTPAAVYLDLGVYIAGTSAGTETIACTNGFYQDGDSFTLAAGATVLVYCVEASPGVYRWAYLGVASAASVPVKATGEEIDTGVDDAKFATPKAIADSGVAMTTDIPVKASGAELDTGTNDTKFVTAKAIADSAIGDVVAWTAFDPTGYITWAVATPAGMTLAGYYRLISGTAEFKVYIVSADPSDNVGKIGSMTFPVGWQPKQLSMHYEISGLHRKDTGGANTGTTMQGWIDASQAVAANRVLTFMNAVVWADNEGTELMFSGSFQYV